MPEPQPKRKLAAILSADVVGYSRLMTADEAATVATLKDYRAVMARVITRRAGRVVNAPGDALLAEFPSVVEAVQCAVEIQQVLTGRNVELPPERRMQFRIGVNLGDVIEEVDGTLYGDGVNIAARMEALAEAGGVCISSTVYDAVEGKLALGFDFLGEQQVKNIAKPVRVYRVRAEPRTPSARRGVWRRRRVQLPAISAAALILLIAAGVLTWEVMRSRAPAEDPALALPKGPSIAVLPFANLGGDPKQGYFADGITEEIITRLSRFLNLRVLARNSTFQYKGKSIDVRQVGRELGADYVLEGSIRRDSKRLRATAQLLDAHDGSHVWAQSYDRDLSASALFDAQDDITNRIAAAIASTHGAIALARTRELRRKAPQSLDSYDCVLLGYEAERLVSHESHVAAFTCLQRAVERDPSYAEAWAWLADSYIEGAFGNWKPTVPPGEAAQRAQAAAQRALKLDPDNQWARAILAKVHHFLRDRPSAVAEAERAIALNPNNTQVLADLAWRFCAPGYWERGVALMEKAIALNPNPPGWYFGLLTLNHYRLGQLEQALSFARKAEVPDFYWSYIYLATINARLGRKDEARAAVDKLLALYPGYGKVARQDLEIYLYGNPELTNSLFQDLRKAGLEVPQGA